MKLKKKLYVFDFDDTLVTTDCKTLVTHTDGTYQELTPAQFVTYEPQLGDVFDYAQFCRLINPRELDFCMSIFRRVYDKLGTNSVVILSARVSVDPIYEFLTSAGMPDVEVRITPNPDPQHKVNQVEAWILERQADDVYFFDDAIKNVQAVAALHDKYPSKTLISYHIVGGKPSIQTTIVRGPSG